MSTNPIDRSLAFTALLEHDPSFGSMEQEDASGLISKLLTDYNQQGSRGNLYEFTRDWVQQHSGAVRAGAEQDPADVVQMYDADTWLAKAKQAAKQPQMEP
jgi:hypothetical protein